MTNYTVNPNDLKQINQAFTFLMPELRTDAAIMTHGLIAKAVQSLPIPKVASVLSHANMGSGNQLGLFQQSASGFADGLSQWSSGFQSLFNKNGWNKASSVQGSVMSIIGQIHQSFMGVIGSQQNTPALFHANWAQIGPQFLSEMLNIKQQYPQWRLSDLEKGTNGAPKYTPKFDPAFFSKVRAQPKKIADILKTACQNEEMMWSQIWKKNGMGNPSRRAYPHSAFKAALTAVFKGL